jgi:hypothetical protein
MVQVYHSLLLVSTQTFLFYSVVHQQSSTVVHVMGRSKPSQPKRRRIEDDVAEQDAIEYLRRTPQDQIEKAAADATRADLVHWPHLSAATASGSVLPCSVDEKHGVGNDAAHDGTAIESSGLKGVTQIPSWLKGLGAARALQSNDFASLRVLHQLIKARAPQWASWSGVEQDPRKRAFGFLPGTLGYDPECRAMLDISMPWRELVMGSPDAIGDAGFDATAKNASILSDTDEAERRRNERAIVVLDEIPDGIQEAIDNVCRSFRETLRASLASSIVGSNTGDKVGDPDLRYYQKLEQFLQYSNLIAAQPNLHNGRELLPSHLDHPLKDGFGVAIVTVAMRGNGTILVQDVTGSQRMAMRLEEGGGYMLAGRSRDACIHGVLADPDAADRESLNLRFGLHNYDPNRISRHAIDEAVNVTEDSIDNDSSISNSSNGQSATLLPVIAASQVLKFWDDPSYTSSDIV